MEFRVLGPLLAVLDDEVVSLGPPLQRKVLAALLVRRNVTVPRRTLLADVWSADAAVFDDWELDERKRGILHTYIARLRAVLEPMARAAGQEAVIVTEGAGYRLVLDDKHLDETRFKDLLAEGHHALSADRPAVAVQRLDLALSLWRGRPLDGFHDEEFARASVARLEALRLGALEARVDALLRLDRHHELIGDAGLREWVREHPASERLRHGLATALHRCGRTAAAIAESQEGLAHLRGLGIGSPSLQSLLEELLLPSSPAAVVSTAPPAPPAPPVDRPHRAGRSESTPQELADAADTLHRMVRRQWQAEAALRRLADPGPIPVRWRPSDREITDHEGIVGGTVAGNTDAIEAVVAAFQALRWRRLVVLGTPGSGKTTLAVLMTVELAARRRPGEPVPILLSMSSWHPDEEHLHAWIRRRIVEDYPALADPRRFGGTAIRDLVADRWIMPVLDGLDEMPAGRRPAALRSINRSAAAGDSLVVTSRLAEYRAAVAAGDVITGAAVIEAQPVRAVDAITYLRHTAPPGARTRRWTSVFGQLADAPDSPVATALTSPLAVVTARLVYAGDRDPGELTDPVRFPDRAAIEDHLLDELIPTLVERDAHRDDPHARGRRRRDPEAVRRWLVFLATHAHRLGTYDLAWWQLPEAVPALARRRGRALIAGGMAGAIALVLFSVGALSSRGLAQASLSGIKHGLAYGLGTLAAGLCTDLGAVAGAGAGVPRRRVIGNILRTGLAGGSAAGLVHLVAAGIEYRAMGPAAVVGLAYGLFLAVMFGLAPTVAAVPGPTRTDLRLRGRGRRLIRGLGWGLALGAAAGLAIGAVEHASLVLARHGGVFVESRLVFGFAPGLVFGLIPGVASSLIIWARTPIALQDAGSPRSTLRADRTQYLALVGMLAAVAASAFTIAAALSLPDGVRAGVRFGFFAGLGGSTVVALVLGFTAVWPRYALTRVWLAAHRKVPWRLIAFLEDANRIGILRQVGAVYQFRHANLQDRLVAGRPGRHQDDPAEAGIRRHATDRPGTAH